MKFILNPINKLSKIFIKCIRNQPTYSPMVQKLGRPAQAKLIIIFRAAAQETPSSLYTYHFSNISPLDCSE